MRTLIRSLSAGVVLLATIAAPAAAAPAVLAREAASFTADAVGDVYAWSAYDAAAGRYSLRLSRTGVVTTPAIAGRGAPFDLDLGRLAGGGIGAVYSRCADDVEREGCDLYLYDLAAESERKLEAVSSPTRSETRPSLEGDRVAFARTASRNRSLVYTGPITGAPGSIRQPTPRVGGATEVELSGGRVFYHWFDSVRADFGRVTLYRVRRDRAVRMFDTESGGANFSNFVGLGYVAGRVYFAETNQGSGTGNRLYRSTLGGTRLDEARGSAAYASVSWTGDAFLVARGVDGPSTLELTDPIVWRRAVKQP